MALWNPSHLRFTCELGTVFQLEGSIGEPLLSADGKAAWWASVWFIW